MQTDRHVWIRARSQCQWEPALAGLGKPLLARIDAHRHRRGPYSGAGALARALAPDALDRCPDVVGRHDIELPALAPELRALVPGTRETLTSLADAEERTRFYPRARTTRLAHGLVEFLIEYLTATGRQGSALVVENADHADPTDAEFLTILVRRIDPRLLTVVVCSAQGDVWDNLAATLATYAEVVDIDIDGDVDGDARSASDDADAADYVAGDCTSDDPRLLAAYRAISPAARAALHDARADELAASNEASLRWGAIALHRERGSHPQGNGAQALEEALEDCVLLGYYEAVIDLGHRCLALLDWDREPDRCWMVCAKMATAFTVLDRPDEAAAVYDEACARTTLPSVHLQSAYGRAMLYTRFYEAERKDHAKAKAWINTAIAIASLYPERERRAYNLTFQENGLALVEMHMGDLGTSLRLVTEGLRRLEEELPDGRETLHRSVLRYNRAQLLTRLGPLEEALEAYTAVIAADPHHSEYWFERAAVQRKLGRLQEALADYDEAIRLSPPYPEPHYNRADLALELGDVDTALAELSYVLELDPSFVDAYLNRANALYELGDLDGAAADVATGLRVDPRQASLHCLRGLIALDQGDAGEARTAFDDALRLEPGLVAALSNRAILHFEAGNVEDAIADLTRASDLDPDPTLRLNRGVAFHEAGRWVEAIADLTAALEGAAEPGELLYRRGMSYRSNGEAALARADFEACLATGDSEYAGLAAGALARPLRGVTAG
ncbi:MAG: tetratricopeptide repeat protein [Acidimicrobiales bacterium]